MKWTILSLIFGSICFLGYKFGNVYTEKQKFYYEFCNFIVYIKNQIGFFKTNIIEILSGYETKNKHLNILIANFKDHLNGADFKELSILNKSENEQIFNFLKGIGLNDCLTQNEYLENNLNFYKKLADDSKQLNLKYGVLYKKLGVLVAVFVFIVLV